ncbi:MAG: NAD-dependent epimerase/dehydratase family protein [Promethearchaeia archaeon]
MVTGGAGYIGSVLSPRLLDRGYGVRVVDKLFFGDRFGKQFDERIEVVQKDIRTVPRSIFRDVDIVIHLAAISQPDPTGQLKRRLYEEINYEGTIRIARLARKSGVRRFIFASTCSVYGSQDKMLDEISEPKPLEIYGKTKLKAEKELLEMGTSEFAPTVCRFATVFGYSPKMRFDLVVNGMTWSFYKYGKIRVMRDGSQWRPNVHLNDVVRALCALMEGEKALVDKEIFNIGSNALNFSVLELAKSIGSAFGDSVDLEWYGEPDTRSYNVDFSKLQKTFNLNLSHTVEEGSREVYKALSKQKTAREPRTLIIQRYKDLSERSDLIKI